MIRTLNFNVNNMLMPLSNGAFQISSLTVQKGQCCLKVNVPSLSKNGEKKREKKKACQLCEANPTF